MKGLSATFAVLALFNFGGEAAVTKEIFQYSLFGVKITNSLDNCYFFYGTPKVGLRDYDSTTDEFEGDTTWSDICTTPWGRNEQEVFCRSFGWHSLDITWDKWPVYDNIFVETATSGTGCNETTDASLADCDYGGRNTPACGANTGTFDEYYAPYDTAMYRVRPVVYCQASTSRLDPVQCLNTGEMVEFSEPLYWKGKGQKIFSGAISNRKKRDVSDQEIEVVETETIVKDVEDSNTQDLKVDIFESNSFYNKAEQDTRKNLLLLDPLEIESLHQLGTREEKDAMQAFWDLVDSYGLDKERTLHDSRVGRSKRAIPAEVYCGNRNVLVKFKHYAECHCATGFKGTFCESDVDECEKTTSVCTAPRKCINTVGSYYCDCPEGYILDNMGNCTDIDECATKNGLCSQVCENLPGSYNCSCDPGYTLLRDQKSCQDIDECEGTNICDPTISECRNTYGSYRCVCNTGYTLNALGVCEDIDECVPKSPCVVENSVCTNTKGSYKCSCQDGLEENIDGVCVAKTTLVVRVPLRLPEWNDAFLNKSSPEYQALCEEVKKKARVTDLRYNYESTTCEISRKNIPPSNRRKRQVLEEIFVDLQQTFGSSMDLAEQSQATFQVQEQLAEGSQVVDVGTVNGVNYGEADITDRAELVKAQGLTLNQTKITEVCYLYDLVQYCREGSSCIEGDGGKPTCQCSEGFTGDQCDEQVISALSTSTIFLLAACIGLFFALLGLCFSHIYHMRKLHALEKFVGYRYHLLVMNDRRYPRTPTGNASTMAGTVDQPRSWLPQPTRRHYAQQPAYFSHWS